MSEPETPKKTVNPLIAYSALAASILALFLGSRGTETPKAVESPQPPAVVISPPATSVEPAPVPPPVEPVRPKVPEYEPNKQGICFIECKRLGYSNGCYSGVACHCVKD